jgi:hypothetical protein
MRHGQAAQLRPTVHIARLEVVEDHFAHELEYLSIGRPSCLLVILKHPVSASNSCFSIVTLSSTGQLPVKHQHPLGCSLAGFASVFANLFFPTDTNPMLALLANLF